MITSITRTTSSFTNFDDIVYLITYYLSSILALKKNGGLFRKGDCGLWFIFSWFSKDGIFLLWRFLVCEYCKLFLFLLWLLFYYYYSNTDFFFCCCCCWLPEDKFFIVVLSFNGVDDILLLLLSLLLLLLLTIIIIWTKIFKKSKHVSF